MLLLNKLSDIPRRRYQILQYRNPHLARFVSLTQTEINPAVRRAAQTIYVGDVTQESIIEVNTHERMRRIVDSFVIAGGQWRIVSRIG